MGKSFSHLVFYDGECGLCDRFVQILLKIDRNKIFAFAPLQGKTAAQLISHLPPKFKQADSLIVVENYQSADPKIYLWGQAVFRILWLMGGWWALIGWLSFLPGWLFNWAYRLVARYRQQLFAQTCLIPPPDQKERFLP